MRIWEEMEGDILSYGNVPLRDREKEFLYHQVSSDWFGFILDAEKLQEFMIFLTLSSKSPYSFSIFYLWNAVRWFLLPGYSLSVGYSDHERCLATM